MTNPAFTPHTAHTAPTVPAARTVHYDEERDVMTCDCGNEPGTDGFFPCDEEGLVVDPSPEDWTSNRYRCMRCGAISEPLGEPEPERPPRQLPALAMRRRGH